MYVGIDVFLKVSPHRNVPGGAHIVVQRMPERDGEFEYRVKSSIEPRERVVGERNIDRTIAFHRHASCGVHCSKNCYSMNSIDTGLKVNHKAESPYGRATRDKN